MFTKKNPYRRLFFTLAILVITTLSFIPSALTQNVTISNIQLRYDTGGNVIDAHDGGLTKFGDRYYLYGTAYGNTDGFTTANHYHCYSSADLTTWTFHGDLITNPPSGVYYRPHVIYNAATHKYVLWYNWYATLWNGQYGVATSDTPQGPFTIQNQNVAVKYLSSGVGDENLFVDTDGTAYLIYNTISGHDVSIERLSSDYLSSTQQSSGFLPPTFCEAPAMFKRNGIYYALFDTCCAFCTEGSGARVSTATSPLGPYTFQNNINRTSSSSYPVAAAINGDRKGLNWENGGGWNDNTSGVYPDWAQVDFNGNKSITEIDVFTLQDNYQNPSEPTETMTFSQYGITAFDVQYWNGSSWVTVPNGSVTGNNKVWRKFTFSAVSTGKIRVVVNNSLAGYSRITEIEAWAAGVNVALTSNGGTASASSEFTGGSGGTIIIHAQQTHIAELATTSGTAYIWMGDLWGSRPDGIKGHDFQYWSAPLQFDVSGNISTLSWTDSWTVDLAVGPTATPGATPTPTPTATPTPTGGSLANFFNQAYTGSRNNFTGYVGYQFTPSSNITVTALGRAVSSGMNNSHAVKIWKVSDQSVVASVTVTTSSAADALGYKYELLGTPVTLNSGTAYRIASYETSGGDRWMDCGSVSNHRSIATIQYGVHDNGTNGYPSISYGSAEQGYVPPAFYTGNGPVSTPTPTPARTSFFNQSYTGSRNNHTGYVGYQFTPSSNLTVTALGRSVSGSLNNNHLVKIWRVSDQSVVASVTITPSSATDALGYKYEVLGTPVTLTSGAAYRIASYETSGGDSWRDIGSLSNHSSVATIQYGVHDNGTNGYPSYTYGSSEQGYVPPVFYY